MAEENRNDVARAKKEWFDKGLRGDLYSFLQRKFFLEPVIWAAEKQVKPLKTAVELRNYLDKNTRIRGNVPIAFPDDVYSTLRASRSGETEQFLRILTANRVSNLSIAREYDRIKAARPENHENEYEEWNEYLPNGNVLHHVHDTSILGVLKKKSYVDDTMDSSELDSIIQRHKHVELWLEGSQESYDREPRRKRAEILLTLPEIHFLLILLSIKDEQEKAIDELKKGKQAKLPITKLDDFATVFRGKINKVRLSLFLENDRPKTEELKEKIQRIFTYVSGDKLNYILKKEEPYYVVNDIDWNLLFKEGEAGLIATPKHIAIGDAYGDSTVLAYHLHHAMWISHDILIEQLVNKESANSKGTSYYISLKSMADFLKYARSINNEMFIIPYENPYPANVLRRRALWTLGKFPYYSAKYENCESMPSWVFENNQGNPSMCVPARVGLGKWQGRSTFFANYMVTGPTGYNPEEAPVRGGKTRKQRKASKRTRRQQRR